MSFAECIVHALFAMAMGGSYSNASDRRFERVPEAVAFRTWYRNWRGWSTGLDARGWGGRR